MITRLTGAFFMSSISSSFFILSVGGSIVVPKEGIDVSFLKGFKRMIERYTKEGHRFVIVVGGGGTSRYYQQAAKQVGTVASDDLDWLGIHSTRLNAHLLRTVFRDIAHPVVVKDPSRPLQNWTAPVLIAAGWKPGWSTDYVAMRLAKRLHAKTVVNLSNIDRVYSKDPRKHSDAVPLDSMSWKAFRELVGNTWNPGMNTPFDPVASRLGEQIKAKVIIANGTNLKNTDRILSGKKFEGTVIG